MLMSKIWPGHQVIGILLGFFTERRACSQKRLGVASTSLNMALRCDYVPFTTMYNIAALGSKPSFTMRPMQIHI